MLQDLNRVNILFQLDNAFLVKLLEDLVNLFKTLRKQVMQPATFSTWKAINNFNFEDPRNILSTSTLFLGVEYILEASKMCPGRENADMLPNVKERCKEFLIELLKDIKKRLPTNLEQLELLAQLSPEVILSENKPHLSKCLLCSFTKEMLQRLNANGTTSRKSSGTTNTKAQT